MKVPEVKAIAEDGMRLAEDAAINAMRRGTRKANARKVSHYSPRIYTKLLISDQCVTTGQRQGCGTETQASEGCESQGFPRCETAEGQD